MDALTMVESICKDYSTHHRYGEVKLTFKAGELVFVKVEHTLIPTASAEKNSAREPEKEHGSYHNYSR